MSDPNASGSQGNAYVMVRVIGALFLLPFDFVRLTCSFIGLTFRVLHVVTVRRLTGIEAQSRIHNPCPSMRSLRAQASGQCFVMERVLTSRLLRLFCACGAPEIRSPAIGRSRKVVGSFSVLCYLRALLCFCLVWGGIAWGVLRTVKRFRPEPVMSARNASVAADYLREADDLYNNREFDRARIQYLNAVQHNSEDFQARWGLARCVWKLRRYAEARQMLDALLARNPSHAPAHMALADVLTKQGSPDQAVKHAAVAVKLDSGNADNLVTYGECQRLLGHLTEAREQMESALKLDPQHFNALVLAVNIAFDSSDKNLARKYIRQLLPLVPEDVMARVQLARALRRSGDYAAAKTQLEKILSDDSEMIYAAVELAEVELANGNLSGAISQYKALRDKNPNDIAIRNRLADLLLNAGRLDEAHAEGETLLRQAPRRIFGHMILAKIYILRNLPSAAVVQCREGLELNPGSAEGRMLLVRGLVMQGKTEEAVPLLAQLSKEFPDQPDPLLILSECYLIQKDYKTATELLKTAIEKFPSLDAPLLLQGRLLLAKKDYAGALAAHRKALAVNPKSHVALNNIASMLANPREGQKQDLAQALELASRAWALNPDNAETADTLGWIYALKGDYSTAVSLLAFSARQLPREPMVRYHLAVALDGVNRPADALAQLDQLAGLAPALAETGDIRILREKLQSGRRGQ